MRRLVVMAIAVGTVAATQPAYAGGCTSDQDCKAGRVCVQGECARPGAPAAPATAAPARDAPLATLGVGFIAWEDEGQDVSFNAARHFTQKRPTLGGSGPAKVYLADYATDADWYLTGTIKGKAKYEFDNYWAEIFFNLRNYAGFSIVGAGALIGILGVAFDQGHSQSGASHDTNVRLESGGAIIAVTGVALSALWWTLMAVMNSRANHFTSSLTGEFELRHEGRVEAKFSVPQTDTDETASEWSTDFVTQDSLLSPVWEQLDQQLAEKYRSSK